MGYVTLAIVYIESFFVDLLLYLVIGLGIALALVTGAWAIREYRTPPESKQIRKASNKKKPLLILAGDDGLIQTEIIDKRGPEGVSHTEKHGKLKEHFVGFYPRPTKSPLVLIDDDELRTATNGGTPIQDDGTKQLRSEAIAEYLTTLNTKPTFFQGAKIAIGIAYRGKAIITTIAALAGLKALDDLSTLYPEDMIKVDVPAIKHYISNEWNTSQIEANEADAFKEGQLDSNRNKDLKWWILPVLTLALVLIGLAGLIAVLKFL